MADMIYQGVSRLDADVTESLAGRGVMITATVAGNVNLVFVDGTTLPLPVAVGFTKVDGVAIVGYKASGTTATAVVYKLR